MAEIIKSYDNGSEIKVVYSYTQNVSSNTSTLTLTLYVHRDGYGPSWDQECEAYIKLDGTKVMTYGGAFEIGASWVKIGSTVSKTVTHSSTGEKTVSIEGFFDGYGVSEKVQDLKCSGSVKLTTIPRASGISGISGGTIGSPVTVTISREVAGFTHKVYYTLGNVKNRLLGSDVGTSLTFTPPMSDCSQITGSTKGTATIRVDTYNGSTKIGSSSKNFTLNVPASVVPSFTGISFTRIDGDVPESWGVYVQGKSKVTAAITDAAGAYGSTIKSYSISGGGYSGTESSLTTGFLNTAGEITFTAKITDSRGRTATKTASITVAEYAAPVLSSVSGFRCDAGGTEQDDGEFISLTADFSGASVNGHNTIIGRYRARPEGGDWSDYASLTSQQAAVFAASGDFTFTVQVEVSDAFTSFEQEIIVNSIRFIMDFKAGGAGIAFGKAAEIENTAEFQFEAKFNSPVYGNVFGLNKLPEIPENSDLNDYMDTGCWAVYRTASANTISNIPVKTAGRLEVSSPTGEGIRSAQWSYLRQRYIPYSLDNPVWERNITRDETNVWTYGEWVRTSLSKETSDFVYAEQKVLWSGSWYMDAAKTIVLSEAVNLQPTGIVLLFAEYNTNGNINKSGLHTYFVPKGVLVEGEGNGWGAQYILGKL